MKKIIFIFSLLGLFFESHCIEMNGFDLKSSSINSSRILQGGPPRDGIPSIDNPIFSSVDNLDLSRISEDDRAIVVEVGNYKKVYPINILNWHEVVNDKIGELGIVVSYCPLCGTGVVFSSSQDNKNITFGVSGLLYQSDVLLYDRETESLWSQLLMKSISGYHKGRSLDVVASKNVSYKKYIYSNRDALVLSIDSLPSHFRDYERNPYSNYDKIDGIHFPVYASDSSYHTKTWTLLLKHKSKTLLIPITKLKANSSKVIVKFMDLEVPVYYNKNSNEMFCLKYKKMCHTGYWFALKAFYPNSEYYEN